MLYNIVRFYERDGLSFSKGKVMRRGLTLEEAKAHCKDPETSSSTAVSKKARQHTLEHGAWFDGHQKQDAPPDAAYHKTTKYWVK